MSRVSLFICVVIVIVILVLILILSRRDLTSHPIESKPEKLASITTHQGGELVASKSIDVLRYSFGHVDSRFDITEETLLRCLKEASSIWEKEAGLSLFRYDASARLKINLMFDNRQQRKIEEKRIKAKLDQRGKSYNILVEDYESEISLKRKLESEYETDVSLFNEKSRDHESKALYWNDRGGAPPEEYANLKHTELELVAMKGGLERRRVTLQKIVVAANELAGSINHIVAENNFDIKNYNGRFVESREFEKGVFDGREINIYEFDGEDDLIITLAHEFGHALGFDHVDDPESIMFYKLEKQDTKNIHLTSMDRKLLEDRYKEVAPVP